MAPITPSELVDAITSIGTIRTAAESTVRGLVGRKIDLCGNTVIIDALLGAGGGAVGLLAHPGGSAGKLALRASYPHYTRAPAKAIRPAWLLARDESPKEHHLGLELERVAYQHLKALAGESPAPRMHWYADVRDPRRHDPAVRVLALDFVPGVSLPDFAVSALRQSADERTVLRAIISVGETMQRLHRAGLYSPDPGGANFLVRAERGQIISKYIDLTGVIVEKNGRFLCPAGFGDSAEFRAAVERRGADLSGSLGTLSLSAHEIRCELDQYGLVGKFPLLERGLRLVEPRAKSMAEVSEQLQLLRSLVG